MLDKQQILAKLSQLEFNPEHYVLVCGVACVFYGIRKQTQDIDLACTEAMMDELEKQGYPIIRNETRRLCKYNDIDIFEKWKCHHKVLVEGYYVQSIEDLQRDKLRLNREKDQLDIARIQQYLCASKLRLATLKDVDTILKIANEAKLSLAELNIDQWQYGYPNQATFTTDIQNQELYVYQENAVLGFMMLSFREEKTYRVIDGKWLNEQPYATIHRLAISESAKQRKIASQMIEAAKFIAYTNEVHSLKADTHAGNYIMQKCLEKNGFEYCGVIQLDEREGDLSRLAYQCDFD